ncbi:glucans biosynthesis glucosyltransferase MdoH [Altericroceibacterium spongiae]|nr:glucans biosynthesis glucosyltransferase MdoH [Altericroceibacterium spongiae]
MPANLPEEAPLEMTLQKLEGNPPGSIEVKTTPQGLLGKRLLLIAATGVLGMAASTEVRFAFSRDGLDFIEILLLLLFVPLFCWIAFGFVSSTIGFIKLMVGGHPGFTAITGSIRDLDNRTAVLMPVYNEGVDAVMGRVEAMATSIAAAGVGKHVDFFILSDSNPEHGKEEWAAWEKIAREAPINVYYRRREKNIARKPGNISEWLERFGSAYEYMVILDADSLMSGDAIHGMISIMEQRPSIGLLQTVPMTINARTVFQRWMQFAGYAYGPIASAGLLWWSGSEANFWGHNAIVRVKAFAESCGLPQLGGAPPFGGHILSHDMVESALLRRRGWAVHMLMIDGSYEEFPPTIVDHAIRDRRWMQGNLQHLRLLDAPGLHWTSRMHLLIGASAYLTSPAWLVLIITAIAQAGFQGHNPITETTPPSVLWLTILLLFGPKFMGLTWLLSRRERRERYGGTWSVIKSVLLEIPLAVLLAPVTMVNQLLALGEILLGRSSGWNAQSREAKGLTVRDVLPNLKPHILLGVLFAATVFIDPITAAWLSPLTIGLLTAPWLVSLTSRTGAGAVLGRNGYFKVPPPINVGRVPSELV